jgi:hypothetical protein
LETSIEDEVQYTMGGSSPHTLGCLEATGRVACNLSRGYILGVEVACGDFTAANLSDRMPLLTPESGAGLWMVPFRGIPAKDVRLPLDLIYLDADLRVIEVVELFPTYRVSPSSPTAASVLALPAQSIFSSQTQAGDLLAIGLAEEIRQNQARLFPSITSARAAYLAQGKLEQPAEAAGAAQPQKKETAKPKNWFMRLLLPDPAPPRKAAREALPGLAAYFWTGGVPQPCAVQDISSTGMYVLTEERWYPGTLIQMTVKKTSAEGMGVEASISVLARANRWGNDGVGVSFVVRDGRKSRDADAGQEGAVERDALNRFLARIKPGNG